MDDESEKSQSGADDSNYQSKRDSSPELARISALITRPPKQKSSMYCNLKARHHPSRVIDSILEFVFLISAEDSPSGKMVSGGADHSEHSDATHSASRSDFYTSASISAASAVPTGPGRGRPKGSTNSNKNKNKAQKSSSLAATVSSVSFSEPISTSAIDTSTASRQTSILQTLDQEVCCEIHSRVSNNMQFAKI